MESLLTKNDDARRLVAREAAETYAPRPTSSLAMYFLIGVVLAVLTVAGFGEFYSIDMQLHLGWSLLFVFLIGASAIFLWFSRMRRNNEAQQDEFNRHE